MWNPIIDLDGDPYVASEGEEPVADTSAGSAVSDVLSTVRDLATTARQTSEDLRRAAQYSTGEWKNIRQTATRPTDSQLNWIQRTWFYASDTEKLFMVLGVAGLVVAAWPYIEKGMK